MSGDQERVVWLESGSYPVVAAANPHHCGFGQSLVVAVFFFFLCFLVPARELLGEPLRFESLVHRGGLGGAQHGQRPPIFRGHHALQPAYGKLPASLLVHVVHSSR